jgi:hypothetical protein
VEEASARAVPTDHVHTTRATQAQSNKVKGCVMEHDMTSCEVSALLRSEWTWRLRWPEGGSRGTAALQKKGKQPKEKSIKPKMNAPANRSILNNVAKGAEELRRHDEPDEEKDRNMQHLTRTYSRTMQ